MIGNDRVFSELEKLKHHRIFVAQSPETKGIIAMKAGQMHVGKC